MARALLNHIQIKCPIESVISLAFASGLIGAQTFIHKLIPPNVYATILLVIAQFHKASLTNEDRENDDDCLCGGETPVFCQRHFIEESNAHICCARDERGNYLMTSDERLDADNYLDRGDGTFIDPNTSKIIKGIQKCTLKSMCEGDRITKEHDCVECRQKYIYYTRENPGGKIYSAYYGYMEQINEDMFGRPCCNSRGYDPNQDVIQFNCPISCDCDAYNSGKGDPVIVHDYVTAEFEGKSIPCTVSQSAIEDFRNNLSYKCLNIQGCTKTGSGQSWSSNCNCGKFPDLPCCQKYADLTTQTANYQPNNYSNQYG